MYPSGCFESEGRRITSSKSGASYYLTPRRHLCLEINLTSSGQTPNLGFANANLLAIGSGSNRDMCQTCTGSDCASGLTCERGVPPDENGVVPANAAWRADYHKAHGGTCNDDQIEITGTHTVDTCANACRGHTWTSGYSDLGSGYCKHHVSTGDDGYYPPLLQEGDALYDSNSVQECSNRCTDEYGSGKGFFTKKVGEELRCACASDTCSSRAGDDPYVSYSTTCDPSYCTCAGYEGDICQTPGACTASSDPNKDGTDGEFYCINGGTIGGTTGSCTCTSCDTC